MSKEMGYRDLFVERNYMRNFWANMIGRFGDAIDALAFAWIVYEITGDRSWSALIVAFNMLPTVLLMPLAGVLVERFDKRRVMVGADIGRAVLVGVTTLLYALDLLAPWMLAAFTFLMSTFEAFRIPAGLALYPRLVPREKFTLASAFSQSMTSVFVILGSGAFGLIIATVGVTGAMLINAATFLISAGIIAAIPLSRDGDRTAKLNAQHYFAELKGGFTYLYGRRIIFMICLVGSLLGVLLGPAESLRTPYVQETLHLGGPALSVLSIAATAGMLIGSALFPMLNRRLSKSKLFLSGGFAIAAAYFLYVAIAGIGSPALVYVALAGVSALYGLGGAFLQVVVNVSFMEQIEPAYISRAGSIFNAFASALAPLGALLVAGLATRLTVSQVFMLFGGLTLVTYLVIARSRLFRTIDLTPAIEGGEGHGAQDTDT